MDIKLYRVKDKNGEFTPYWYFDHKPSDGPRIRKSTGVVAVEGQSKEAKESQKTARERAVALVLKAQAAASPTVEGKIPLTIGEACDKYYRSHAQFLPAAKIIENQSKIIKEFFDTETRLSSINKAAVSDFIAHLRSKKTKIRDRNGEVKMVSISNSTINRYLALLRAINNRIKDLEIYEYSHFNLGKLKLTEPSGRVRYLSQEEFNDLIRVSPKYLQEVIFFAVYTGLRKNNIVTLDWSQVDITSPEQASVTVKLKSKKVQGGRVHVSALSKDAYDLLKHKASTIKGKPQGRVFGGYRGASTLGDFKRAWVAALNKAGIKDFRFHDLRHTTATYLVQGGTPLELVQSHLGHTQLSTTQRYSHHKKDAVRNALNQTFAVKLLSNFQDSISA